MKFYLDKLDKNNAWVIIAWDGTDPENSIGWRVDSFDVPKNRTKTLAVFPVPQEVNPRILGVIPVDLTEVTHISIYPIGAVSGPPVAAQDTDCQLYKDFPEGDFLADTPWVVWSVTAEGNPNGDPQLEISEVQRVSRDSLAVPGALVSPFHGNKVYPGRLHNEVDGPAVVEVRMTGMAPDEAAGDGSEKAVYELSLRPVRQDQKGEPLEIEIEHLLAGRDLVPLLEGTEDHIQVIEGFETVRLEDREQRVQLMRATTVHESIGIGFLDRIVLSADRDCVFEYWLDPDRHDFTAGNGLVVFTHLGDGELVQDTGHIRKLFYDQIVEKGKARDKPLFDNLKVRPFKLPWPSNEKYSLPLQFACYDMCRTIHELRTADSSIVPRDMRMFAERAELFFALLHPYLSQIADLEFDSIEQRTPAAVAILNYCKLYLTERFQGDHPELGVTEEDIEDWCSNIVPDTAWNLYELVISGAAEEMIRCGVSFDTRNPTRFAKLYAKKRHQLQMLFLQDKAPTPLRASTLGSKFQPLNEAISTLRFMNSDWQMVERIAIEVAHESDLFLAETPKKNRDRFGLTAREFDSEGHHSILREHIEKHIKAPLEKALQKYDRDNVLDPASVTDVLASWFIQDHDKDVAGVRDLLNRVGNQRDQFVNVFYLVMGKDYPAPSASLEGLDIGLIERTKGQCVTKAGREMIEMLMRSPEMRNSASK